MRKPPIIDAEYRIVSELPPRREPEPPWWAFGAAPGGGWVSLLQIVAQLVGLFWLIVLVRLAVRAWLG